MDHTRRQTSVDADVGDAAKGHLSLVVHMAVVNAHTTIRLSKETIARTRAHLFRVDAEFWSKFKAADLLWGECMSECVGFNVPLDT